jgi:hypothetical protein
VVQNGIYVRTERVTVQHHIDIDANINIEIDEPFPKRNQLDALTTKRVSVRRDAPVKVY